MYPSQTTSDFTYEDSYLARRIRHFCWILMALWTLLIAASWLWSFYAEQNVLRKVAMTEARTVIDRDMLYRRWGASHGGVYAQVSANNPPNPYLSHIPERDIRTPSGKQLTLINPAYMTRQVNELSREGNDYLGHAHLTSLKPLRPENAPDPWEESALHKFEGGADEISDVTVIGGKPFIRLIKAFVTDKPCTKCHTDTIGSVRGGISASIPLQPLIDAGKGQVIGSLAFHSVIWLLGLGVTGAGARKLSRSATAQKQIEKELHLQAMNLEEEIAEHQVAQESLEARESQLRIVADFSSNWEYWRLPDDTFMYMSPSVHELTGYSAADFNSDPQLLYRIIDPEDRQLFICHTHGVGATGQILPIELRIRHKSGEVRWIAHICQQVFTTEGLPWGWRASNQEITARKFMERELAEQAKELEDEVAERKEAQVNLEMLNHSLTERVNSAVAEIRKKDQTLIQQGRLVAMGEMINNVAHQWRQPLNNVGLIIQNLQYSFDDNSISREEMDHEINKAMDIIIRMSRTIDDFRNFFREDKQKTGFFISKTVHKALDFISASLESNNISISLEDDEQLTAIGYQNEYAQVLLNILSNAREAAVERGITAPEITIRITSENGRSAVYIRDNCGGIGADIIQKIFDPYFTTRAPDKGTGIGLYMSKVIIEQNMSGSLTAKNVDNGVEFRIVV